LSAHLRREGYEIVVALDAVQATMLARKETPALILLDLGLPGGNGLRVLENLSRSSATAGIPVLVLTGSSDAVKLARARELGAADCFVKSADLTPLLDRVRKLAGPGQTPQDEAAPGAEPLRTDR
jgi:DNA-binding response OmpR family regulator